MPLKYCSGCTRMVVIASESETDCPICSTRLPDPESDEVVTLAGAQDYQPHVRKVTESYNFPKQQA